MVGLDLVDLETFLERPSCPECKTGRVRAIDIYDGEHLTLQCPIPRCRWTGHARLPEIRKKIIYLDTSTVSHIVRAISRAEDESPWADLYHTLRKAAECEVICCLGSSILESEAELSRYSAEIVRLSREFADPGLKHQLGIHKKQIFRALNRFLAGEQPILETDLDPGEAFHEKIHRWLPMYDISVNMATPREWIESRRKTKAAIRDDVERIYSEYAVGGIPFDAIRKNEAQGFGRAILIDGKQCLRRRLGLEPIPNNVDFLGTWIPNTFDSIVYFLRERLRLSYFEAVAKAEEFLLSDHIHRIPVVDITSKLHAAVAMLSRGASPRIPKASDLYDIEHIASFAPYVDIMIADRFFADLCNQSHLRVGDTYHCQIRSLGQKEVPTFIQDIEALVRNAPQTKLAKRISNAIEVGGFHREFAERARAYLRARGVDPDNPENNG